MLKCSNAKMSEKGFAALFITLLVLLVVLGMAISFAVLTLGQERMSGNITKSTQSYYLAEAGMEDIILRLSKNMKWSSPYNINLAGGQATINISDSIGGSRTITSTGNLANRVRKIQVVYKISTQGVSFYYGAQVGDGGMTMGSGSQVQGNVFSDGDVEGSGTITNSVIIAGNTHKIDGPSVGEDATVHSCYNSNITGNLYYVLGGVYSTCHGVPPPLRAVQYEEDKIDSIPLPISESQINDWKIEAAVSSNNADVSISGTQSLGPIQIGEPVPGQERDLIIQNKAVLNVTGTIYVTGDIITGTALGTGIKLDSSYGSFGGVVLADGTINIGNNTDLTGSGQAGSYILILSTKSGSEAIVVGNNALGAVFYTSAGEIILNNNMKAREITGYQITLNNNAEIQYESGLQNTTFSSGPGGGWEVASWKEIE